MKFIKYFNGGGSYKNLETCGLETLKVSKRWSWEHIHPPWRNVYVHEEIRNHCDVPKIQCHVAIPHCKLHIGQPYTRDTCNELVSIYSETKLICFYLASFTNDNRGAILYLQSQLAMSWQYPSRPCVKILSCEILTCRHDSTVITGMTEVQLIAARRGGVWFFVLAQLQEGIYKKKLSFDEPVI